jgi:SAM-dependent methyltransferase
MPGGRSSETATPFSDLNWSRQPDHVIRTGGLPIYDFQIEEDSNADTETIRSFGEEWQKFKSFSRPEIEKIGDDYFDILPRDFDMEHASVLDAGCGTGRWALYLAPRVRNIECIDPSDAVYSASDLLKDLPNVRVIKTDIDHIPFSDHSFDLVYSLGVLHHIPDTFGAMKKCVEKVKRGGYFIVYLYYNLDNRGLIFRTLFHVTNTVRKGISKLPAALKRIVCDMIAATVYFPLSRLSAVLRKTGGKKAAKKIPLSYYSDKSFWIMRNDALDRFGTPLEQRFSRKEIVEMMERCGLKDIFVSDKEPYWHAIGQKS